MMQSDPCKAFLNYTKTFSNGYILDVTDGHYVEFKKTSTAKNNFIVNISDASYNSDDSTATSNNASTEQWLMLKKGDVVYYRFTLISAVFSPAGNNNTQFNFASRLPGGTAIEDIFGTRNYSETPVGTVLEKTYVANDDIVVSCISSWQAWMLNTTYEITWKAEIYVNGKRIV